MAAPHAHARAGALRLLEELPGIDDVVWTTVLRLAEQRVPASVLFTAAEARAGASVLAAATAVGLAQHQRVPVCLLETNVQRPAQARYLGLEPAGLSDVLDGRAELEDCLQTPWGCPDLLVLPAGSARAPLFGELTSARMGAILTHLGSRCQYLVLDVAPVLEHVESRLLLRQVDAALLVLRARDTLRHDAERAHDILLQSGTPVLGSIFNAYRGAGNRRLNRLFRRAVSTARARPDLRPAPLHGSIAPAEVAARAAERGGLSPFDEGGTRTANGCVDGTTLLAAIGETDGDARGGHQREVELLERRIAKLTRALAQTEADLLRIAALKDVDPGIASRYRGVQGLSTEEAALGLKRSLMQRIFTANLELRTAMARHP